MGSCCEPGSAALGTEAEVGIGAETAVDPGVMEAEAAAGGAFGVI